MQDNEDPTPNPPQRMPWNNASPSALRALSSSDAASRPGHRADSTFWVAQLGQQRWPSGPRWNPGGQARSYPWFGQQRRPSGPRCHPTGHTRLVAKG
jgi:hypothetical protein